MPGSFYLAFVLYAARCVPARESKMRSFKHFLSILILLFSTPSSVFSQSSKSPPDRERWSGWGGNIFNNRWAAGSTLIKSTTFTTLVEPCKITYVGGGNAIPTVLKDVACYPTANASFVALNYVTCSVQWQINVTDVVHKLAPLTALQLNATLPFSRTSSQIDGNVLYFGTQSHALLLAVNLATSATLDVVQINSHELAIVTMSPTAYDGVVYVGAASQEEVASLLPISFGYKCCSFIGTFMAVKFDTTVKVSASIFYHRRIFESNGFRIWKNGKFGHTWLGRESSTVVLSS